jgi:uncharacterized membrane protein
LAFAFQVSISKSSGYTDGVTKEPRDMAKLESVGLFIGTYRTEADARSDYDTVKGLSDGGVLGTYDAAVVTKDAGGKVHVNKDEKATRHGAWGGAAVGAVLGILFPPSIIGTAVVGAAAGGISGHVWRGMSRSDVKELGELIDAGEAALVVVAGITHDDALITVDQAFAKADWKAEKHLAKKLEVSADDIDQAVQSAAREVS